MAGGSNPVKAVLYALGANFGIAITKSVAAAITGSGAMLAEAIHSFSDCANQGLLLFGMKQAKQAPTADFPLGFGKAIYFWSFVVAILLFSVGGMFSVYEGWHKLHAPEALNKPWIAIGVLVVAIGLESVSCWGALTEIRKVQNGRSLWQWFRESRQAELVVILGEDLAALFGLVLALIFVALTMITGNPMWDALGSMAIGVLLIGVAVAVGIEVKSLLMGQSAEAPLREAIEHYVATHPAVARALNIITLHFGDDVMVAVKAHMKENASVDALAQDINQLEAGLKQRFPAVKWIFFEPDLEV